MSIYDYKVKDGNEEIVSLEDYKGKVLLIVNTATGCGFTPQYKGLESLYEKYREEGFEILDFPSNQFANQAPGTNKEIADFCAINFGTKFKQFSKIEVNGEGQEPLFEFLKQQKKGIGNGNIKWNFTKFLVDRNGKVISRFAPMTKPEKLESKIINLLKKQA